MIVAHMAHDVVDREALDRHFEAQAVGLFDDNGLRHGLFVQDEPLFPNVLALHALEVVGRGAAAFEPLQPLLRIIRKALVERRIVVLDRLLARRLARRRLERDLLCGVGVAARLAEPMSARIR